jgi:hypothetical protein
VSGEGEGSRYVFYGAVFAIGEHCWAGGHLR